MRHLGILFLALLAGMAHAQGQLYLAANGDVFSIEENRHGAILTAIPRDQAPVVSGVSGLAIFQPGDVLYLGRSCDAFSQELGEGRWEASTAGFTVAFDTLQISFPGQLIGVGAGQGCRI